MHTVKVELTLQQCDQIEEQLLELANELGKPLNFSLLRIAKERGGVPVAGFKERGLLTGYFKNRKESLEQLALLKLPAPVYHGFLKDRDWQDSVKKHFKPFAYRNVGWMPVWVKKFPSKLKAKTVITLDMGMAFGTGNHPTTRLCLRRLIETVAQYKKPTVNDIGTGSGILAITADKCGAGRVTGFDIDEHSITVARRNVRLNKSKAKLSVGDLYADKLPVCDIVLANLLANLIADNAKKLWASVAAGGTLILSGLLKEELTKTAAHFPAKATHHKLGKWGVLVIRKKA